MDLIYTDAERLDAGVLKDYELDFEIGSENDFQITTSLDNNVIPMGAYFYFENSEYGGKISTLKVDTSQNRLYYGGRTFYGMLCDKIICPDSGEDYYIASGDANAIISALIERLELEDLFVASSESSGFNFLNYKFDRYTDCYSGLVKMLKTKNAKLKAVFKNQHVTLNAELIVDYSNEEFSSDILNFTIEQNKLPPNHLICLGKGDLAERQVLNLYTDENGNVSQTPYYTGLDEVAQTYDYSNVESDEELLKSGTEKLLELQQADQIDITLENSEKDVGDIIGGIEVVTGLRITAPITKKIVKIENNNEPKFTYEIAQAKTS